MKVLFLHPPKKHFSGAAVTRYSIMVVPMGLFGLAAMLEDHGHSAEILHLGVEDLLGTQDLMGEISRCSPDLVGIACHWHHQVGEALVWAREIRSRCPGLPIVMGGLTAGFFHSSLMERPESIDFVVRGDAEVPLLELVNRMDRGSGLGEVPNLSWRRGRRVEHNAATYRISAKEFDAVDLGRMRLLRHSESYSGKQSFTFGEEDFDEWQSSHVFYACTFRGCSWGCRYCGGSRHSQRMALGHHGVVCRSPARACEDMHAANLRGVSRIYVVQGAFPRSKAYYLELFTLAAGKHLEVEVDLELCSNNLPGRAVVDAMASAFGAGRCRLLFLYSSILEGLPLTGGGDRYENKPFESLLRYAARKGITCCINFTPSPFDPVPRLKKMMGWLRTIRRTNSGVRLHIEDDYEVDPAYPLGANVSSNRRLIRRGLDDFVVRHREDETRLDTERRMGFILPNREEWIRCIEEEKLRMKELD